MISPVWREHGPNSTVTMNERRTQFNAAMTLHSVIGTASLPNQLEGPTIADQKATGFSRRPALFNKRKRSIEAVPNKRKRARNELGLSYRA